MKCEVYWKNTEGKEIHPPKEAEATHLTVGSAMDADYLLSPLVFMVCEAHADHGTMSGWVKIAPKVARYLGEMEEVLRKGP